MPEVDVVVVGAGIAGLAAAAEAAAGGARVAVLDERLDPGGAVSGRVVQDEDGLPPAPIWRVPGVVGAGQDRVSRLYEECRRRDVSFHFGQTAWGLFPGWRVAASDGHGTVPWDARCVVLAVGGTITPRAFPGWEVNGVIDPCSLLVRIERGAVKGERVLFPAADSLAETLAARVREAGGRVYGPGTAPITQVRAADRLRAVELADAGGQCLDVDWICPTSPVTAEIELAAHAGARCGLTPGGFVVLTDGDGRTSVPGVLAAGLLAGHDDPEAAEASGRRAGRTAAASLDEPGPAGGAWAQAGAAGAGTGAAAWGAGSWGAADLADHAVICPCEGTTVARVRAAIEAGVANLDDLKRMTHCGMGLCQGRRCRYPALELLAGTGAVNGAPGPMRVRPPVRPLTLRALLEGPMPE